VQKREDLKKALFSLPTKHQVRASEKRGTNQQKASRNSQVSAHKHHAAIGKFFDRHNRSGLPIRFIAATF
jgi:hypothetical protein